MKKKYALHVALPVVATLLLVFFAKSTNSELRYLTRGEEGTPLNHKLDATNSPSSLSESFSDITNATITSLGNSITWSYKEAKQSALGHVTLGKINPGNPTADDAFIGNVSPITSIVNISVDFSGVDYLALYGSPDGQTYYKLFTFDESNLTTDHGNGYLYLRFVNGGQGFDPVTINSISINYYCDPLDFTVEKRDASSNVLPSSSSKYYFDNTEVHNSELSNHSLALQSTGNFFLDFGQIIPAAHLDRYMLEFYISTADVVLEDSNRNNTRVNVKLVSNDSGVGESLYDVGITKMTDGWQFAQVDLSFFTSSSNPISNPVTGIRITPAHAITSGQIYIDEMHVVMKGGYPEYTPVPAWPAEGETYDLSNTTPTICYGNLTFMTDTEVYSPVGGSTQSNRVSVDADWRQWYYAGINTNLANKMIKFDIKFDGIMDGKEGKILLDLILDDSGLVYSSGNITPATNSKPDFVEIIDLGDGWYTLIFNLITMKTTVTPKVSNNFGFKQGYVQGVYLDNIFVGAVE